MTAAIAVLTGFGLPALPALAAPAKNVVLVHGALADGSGWAKVWSNEGRVAAFITHGTDHPSLDTPCDSPENPA